MVLAYDCTVSFAWGTHSTSRHWDASIPSFLLGYCFAEKPLFPELTPWSPPVALPSLICAAGLFLFFMSIEASKCSTEPSGSFQGWDGHLSNPNNASFLSTCVWCACYWDGIQSPMHELYHGAVSSALNVLMSLKTIVETDISEVGSWGPIPLVWKCCSILLKGIIWSILWKRLIREEIKFLYLTTRGRRFWWVMHWEEPGVKGRLTHKDKLTRTPRLSRETLKTRRAWDDNVIPGVNNQDD